MKIKELEIKKTPKKITVGKHIFYRYLMENEYAEEMKCKCGFVIWSCYTDAEGEKAVKKLYGNVNYCS